MVLQKGRGGATSVWADICACGRMQRSSIKADAQSILLEAMRTCSWLVLHPPRCAVYAPSCVGSAAGLQEQAL